MSKNKLMPSKANCQYCGESIKNHNGFYDADGGQYCCWNCRNYHYWLKNRSEYEGLYTEFPVVVISEEDKK